jgi:regulator of replication initiation timing
MSVQLEDKVVNLENQAYITYLQINSLIKQLAELKVIETEALIKDMDDLNSKLVEAVEAEIEKSKTEETVEEVAAY